MHSKNQRRHCSPSSSSRTPLLPVRAKMAVGRTEVDPLPFRVPRDYPHSRFSKAPLAVYPPKGARAKACVSLPVVSLEKIPCLNRSEGGSHIRISSSAPAPGSSTAPAPQKIQEKFLNGRGPGTPRSATPPSLIDRRPSPSRPAPSPAPQDRRPDTSSSPSLLDRRPAVPPSPPPDRKHPNGAKGGRHRRVSGRVFDPNKHCGVQDPETKRPCTRSLTCKTHSLTHRRSVPGRRKDFDILLAEHKGRAKDKEVGPKKEAQAGSQSVQLTQSHDAVVSLSASCTNGKTTPTLKLQLANAHLHRPSGGGAVALSSAPAPPPEPVLMWQRSSADAHLSSDEAEPELVDEAPCHYSTQHPRPMSCGAFSSRLMGRGHYVFDRRWDRVRLALHCMVEKHVNSLMWRKVPLAVESVTSSASCPSDAPPNHTPAAPLDGVSMLSFSHNGAGVYCIRDPESEPRPQRNKPAQASGAGPGPRKRKTPPTSEPGAFRRSGNSFHLHISNGSPQVKSRPRDPERHGPISTHCPLTSDSRKRRSSGSSAGSDKPCKTSKAAVLDGIFRKSSGGPLTSVSRQPKVPH